ncbi:MAG: hypothetical protein JWO01_808 [Microbacteriaceae bacterium]|nr:hypothetical protein [Microbacteriaceae bacterium]
MAGWGIAEWYGQDILTMTPEERLSAANSAIAAGTEGMRPAPQPECPFLSSLRPGSVCNKLGGVCSLRQYANGDPATPLDAQPTTSCPNRFLEFRNDETLFSYIARVLFGVSSGTKVIKEIPFLEKETVNGEGRGAKAGRIDWIVVPTPPSQDDAFEMPWVAVETQAVYFSGASMWPDIEAYRADPSKVHYPSGIRRPDFRSSGAKRLAPQLSAKGLMNRWGRKIVVVVDEAFFAEMGALSVTTDFDNSEIVWIVVRFDTNMALQVEALHFAELLPSIAALQAAKPVNRATFEANLRRAIVNGKSAQVFDA